MYLNTFFGRIFNYLNKILSKFKKKKKENEFSQLFRLCFYNYIIILFVLFHL